MAIPHNHPLDGRLHERCPSCAYTKLKMRRTAAHKEADRGLKSIYEKAVQKYQKETGKR